MSDDSEGSIGQGKEREAGRELEACGVGVASWYFAVAHRLDPCGDVVGGGDE